MHIFRTVSPDGRTLEIEFLNGPMPRMTLTREEAIALLEVLEEQLPRMATKP